MPVRNLTTLSIFAVLALIAAVFTAAGPVPADDIAAIKKNTAAFQAAWNAHNAKGVAALWATDGDLIDPWGATSVGREAVEKFFSEQYTEGGKLARCMYDNRKDSVRLISADVAIQDWEVVLRGLSGPDGKPMGPQFHRVVLVVKKEKGEWRIAAARPGIPTPAEQPAAGGGAGGGAGDAGGQGGSHGHGEPKK
ncbi:MAG: SgcJ/EcaC family oxidoreductase [Phycisphaerales bacterium]|nr:SgcJ/EcaC family oxidoreductase [Phycisphaerales bacterium]